MEPTASPAPIMPTVFWKLRSRSACSISVIARLELIKSCSNCKPELKLHSLFALVTGIFSLHLR